MIKCLFALLAMFLVVVPVVAPASVAAQGTGNTRETPYPLGEAGMVGDYNVRVLEVTTDATDLVLQENQFNDPPAPGHVFVMARVEVTYHGVDTGTPWIDLDFHVVGDANRGYSESQASCGVIPDEASDAPELFAGGTAEFNTCWSVPEAEVPSLVMYVEESFSFDSVRVWFALYETSESGQGQSASVSTPTATTGIAQPAPGSSMTVGTTVVSWADTWTYDPSSSMNEQITLTQVDPSRGELRLATYGEFADVTVNDPQGAMDAFTDSFFQSAGAQSVIATHSGFLQQGGVWKQYEFDLQGLALSMVITVSAAPNGEYIVSTLTANTESFEDSLAAAQSEIFLDGQPTFLSGVDA